MYWSQSTKYYMKNIHRSNLKAHLDREFLNHSYHFELIIYYDPLLSNLINKTSILDFFIITRLSLLLLIRLNDNPLVSKKYIGLTTCFNFILMTSEWRRRGSFLIDLIHPVATVSLVYRLLTYEKRIGNEGTNFTWHTHVCNDVLDVHVCKAYKHQSRNIFEYRVYKSCLQELDWAVIKRRQC